MELALPKNCIVIEEDEMMNLDGGLIIRNYCWGLPVNLATVLAGPSLGYGILLLSVIKNSIDYEDSFHIYSVRSPMQILSHI